MSVFMPAESLITSSTSWEKVQATNQLAGRSHRKPVGNRALLLRHCANPPPWLMLFLPWDIPWNCCCTPLTQGHRGIPRLYCCGALCMGLIVLMVRGYVRRFGVNPASAVSTRKTVRLLPRNVEECIRRSGESWAKNSVCFNSGRITVCFTISTEMRSC